MKPVAETPVLPTLIRTTFQNKPPPIWVRTIMPMTEKRIKTAIKLNIKAVDLFIKKFPVKYTVKDLVVC